MTPPDYDDLCKRLRDAEESQPNVGFGQTADALVALRKQLREAESELALADKALAKAEAENATLRQALKEFLDVLAYAERDGIKEGIKRAYDMGRAALLAGKKP